MLEDSQAAGELAADIAVDMADGEAIRAEIIGDEAMSRVLVITAEPESTGAMAHHGSDVPAKKTAGKGKGKKGTTTTESTGE